MTETRVYDLLGVRGGVVFSNDRRYRYRLSRRWGAGGRALLFVMLNPSLADDDVDDQTLRRCVHFATAAGYDGLLVANLYALVATDPAALARSPDPLGPDNGRHLEAAIAEAEAVAVAWGAHPLAAELGVAALERILAVHEEVLCLGRTKEGAPRHPSRLGNAAALEVYARRPQVGSLAAATPRTGRTAS